MKHCKLILLCGLLLTLCGSPASGYAQKVLTHADSIAALQRLDSLVNDWQERELDEAVVKAHRSRIKAEIDKVSYLMEEDPDAKTNTMLEMLRKVPMVTVDGNDDIKVNGSSSFKIYVNGKPNAMLSANAKQILKVFPANYVKRVEVITDPGAKYDAEGVSGILNFIVADQTSTAGWTLTPRIDVGNQYSGGSLFAMAQVGKLAISANYGATYFDQSDVDVHTENTYRTDNVRHLLVGDANTSPYGFFQHGSLDASYEFSPRDLLSVSAGVFGHNAKTNVNALTRMYDIAGNTIYGYRDYMGVKVKNMSYNFGADYQHTFLKAGREASELGNPTLTFSYRLDYTPSYDRRQQNFYDIEGDIEQIRLFNGGQGLMDLDNRPDRKSKEHTLQADYLLPLDTHHTFATGLKYIRRINESEDEEKLRPVGGEGEFILNPDNSVHYRHTNDIKALYGEYTYKLNAFTTRAGLRYEHSHVGVSYPDGSQPSYSKNFSDLVPSLSVAYNISALQMLKLSYAMRIGRPDISYLAPYVNHESPHSITYGNPTLESERAHNIEATYSYFNTKFSVSATVGYSAENNGLTDYFFLDEANLLHKTYQNFKHSRRLSFNMFVNWSIFSTTQLTLSCNGGYDDMRVDAIQARQHGWQGMGFLNIRQELPWKLKLSAYGGYGKMGVQLQGTGSTYYFSGLSLTRAFLKEDRLDVSLSVGNFIKPVSHYKMTEEAPTYFSSTNTRMNNMHFSIGISWRFGKLQSSVKKASRTISNDDVESSGSSSVGGAGGVGGGVGGGQMGGMQQ